MPSNLLDPFKPFTALPLPPLPDPLPPGTPWWGVGLVRLLTYLAWAGALAIVILALSHAVATGVAASAVSLGAHTIGR